MDHIDFIKSINIEDFENSLRLFFDQIMAAYNLIGRFQGMDISTEIDENVTIRFIILTSSEEEARELFSILCDRIIPIYGHTYIARLTQINNSLNIEIVEKASG